MDYNNVGILDVKGVNLNPLTHKPYSEHYKTLASKWSKLPTYEKRFDIINSIKNNQVTIIITATGTGKTVLVPKLALHYLKYNGKIGVTLPKQILTQQQAEYAAETLDVTVGIQVGYQYKGSDKEYGDNNNMVLLYMTDGSIVSQLMNNPLITNYDIIIIDEAHERKVQIDFLLYLLRNTLRKRPEFKLIIMSATINEKIFEDYYKEFTCGKINIGTSTNYKIESVFLKKSIDKIYI